MSLYAFLPYIRKQQCSSFCKSLFTCNVTHHEYHIRHNLQLVIPYSHTSLARKSVRYHIPSLLRSLVLCYNWQDPIQGIYANATMAERGGGGGVRVGGGVHDSCTLQCGLVGYFTSPGIDTR